MYSAYSHIFLKLDKNNFFFDFKISIFFLFTILYKVELFVCVSFFVFVFVTISITNNNNNNLFCIWMKSSLLVDFAVEKKYSFFFSYSYTFQALLIHFGCVCVCELWLVSKSITKFFPIFLLLSNTHTNNIYWNRDKIILKCYSILFFPFFFSMIFIVVLFWIESKCHQIYKGKWKWKRNWNKFHDYNSGKNSYIFFLHNKIRISRLKESFYFYFIHHWSFINDETRVFNVKKWPIQSDFSILKFLKKNSSSEFQVVE